MARRTRAKLPPAPRVLDKLRRRLDENAWAPGLTVLTGDDSYHLDLAQRALLEFLVPDEASDFALSVFGEESVDVSKIVAAARSRGMFATRRVVLVREVGALDGEPKPLIDYAADPPADSFLLVRAPALDQRRKLHKALAKNGTLVAMSLEGCSGSDLMRLLTSLAAEHRLKLDRGAAALFLDVCGTDLYRVAGELAKLSAWLGGSGTRRVDLETAREMVSGSASMSGWEVSDAVLRRDRAAAVSAARRLVERGENPIGILGGLAWRTRTMLQAKALQESGAPRKEIVAVGRAWSIQDEFFSGIGRYSLDELRGFPRLLLEADRTFKSRGIDPGAVLEALLLRLTGEGPGANRVPARQGRR
jgi:DNA polymerase-3 subunit delta